MGNVHLPRRGNWLRTVHSRTALCPSLQHWYKNTLKVFAVIAANNVSHDFWEIRKKYFSMMCSISMFSLYYFSIIFSDCDWWYDSISLMFWFCLTNFLKIFWFKRYSNINRVLQQFWKLALYISYFCKLLGTLPKTSLSYVKLSYWKNLV